VEGVLGPISLVMEALAARLTIEQVTVVAPHGRWRLLAFVAGAAHGLSVSVSVCVCAVWVAGSCEFSKGPRHEGRSKADRQVAGASSSQDNHAAS
jgi:hypothetical protein